MNKSGFVIISSQRSGSTLLINILNQHPEIICAGEIFKEQKTSNILHPEFTFDLPSRMKSIGFKLSPGRIVSKHLKKCLGKQDELFGFKLMTSQMDRCPSIGKAIDRLGLKKIVLIRGNIAYQSLSLEMARTGKKWSNISDSTNEQGKTELNLKSLEKTLGYVQKSHERLLSLAKEEGILLIDFDNLIHEQKECLLSITEYLGLAPEFEYELEQKPSSTLSYAERLSNFSEVESLLQNHKLHI